MKEEKKDNEYLEEILYHTNEMRKSAIKTQGNTFVIVVVILLGIVMSLAINQIN